MKKIYYNYDRVVKNEIIDRETKEYKTTVYWPIFNTVFKAIPFLSITSFIRDLIAKYV